RDREGCRGSTQSDAHHAGLRCVAHRRWPIPRRLAASCTSRHALAPVATAGTLAHLDAVSGYVYDPDCPSRRLSLGRWESPRGAWLAMAGPRRGRHAVGYGLTAGVCIADDATLDPTGGSPDAGRGPQCRGHGLAASRRLSIAPCGGADCSGPG